MMSRVYWVGRYAIVRGGKAVEAHVHVPGIFLGEFLRRLKEKMWVASDCGEYLLLPARSPCPEGTLSKRMVAFSDDELGLWRVVTVTRVMHGDKPLFLGFLRPVRGGLRGGLFHTLCNDAAPGEFGDALVRPRWRSEGERVGSLRDIECFEKEVDT